MNWMIVWNFDFPVVCPLVPRRVRLRKEKEAKEAEELKAAGEAIKEEEIKMEEEEASEAPQKEKKPKKSKRRYVSDDIESLRDKNGAMPCWVSQRHITRAYIERKIKKNRKARRQSLKLFWFVREQTFFFFIISMGEQ